MARGATLLFFASAREAVGRSRIDWPLAPGGAEVAEVVAALQEAYPRLAPILRSSRLVLNGRYLGRGPARLVPGDELAVHPPYSGG